MSDSLSGSSSVAQDTGEEDKRQKRPTQRGAPATPDNSLQGLASRVQELGQEASAEHARPMPDVPAPVPLPPPPKFEEPNPIQAFGSIGTMIAVFGSLLARRPLVTAFNGIAGAVKAYQQNNVMQYKLGMEQWKTNSQYAIDVTKQMSTVYHNILDSRKMTDKEKLDEMSIAAHAFQDQLGIANLAERSMAAAQAHADRVANMAQRASLAQQRMSLDERMMSYRLMPQEVAAKAADSVHALTGTGAYKGKPHDIEYGGFEFTPKDFSSYMSLVKSNPTLESLQTDMANSDDAAQMGLLMAKIEGVKLSGGGSLTPKQRAMAMLFAQAAKSPDGFKILGEDLTGIEKPLPMARPADLSPTGTTEKGGHSATSTADDPPKMDQGLPKGAKLPTDPAQLKIGKYYWNPRFGWAIWDGKQFFKPAMGGIANRAMREYKTVFPPYNANSPLDKAISGGDILGQ